MVISIKTSTALLKIDVKVDIVSADIRVLLGLNAMDSYLFRRDTFLKRKLF